MTGSSDESRQSAIEEAVRQFVDARWQGQAPDIEEFTRQYPGLDREIRQGIRDAQRIDALFDSLVQADQSDFKGAVAGDDLVGQTIGGFEVVEMIGRGGMGVVYLARDTKLDRSVAIKSMPAKLVGDSTTQMRFGREAKLLASLNHPNIAVIHNVIERDEGAAYLILEYIPGDTLAERIAREPLKLEEALSIGLQVAKAVSAAHREGVAHRDLKPSNIKITPDGRVKVLDFGLAKPSMSEGKGDEVTVTDPGRIIGTPAYMSPEQARGKETDQRTDIWSFGCIMYEMLTGQLPFEGETATDTLAHIIEREPDWDLLPRSTPESIRMLLQQCLNKDLKRRLRDITDATSTLDEAMTLSAPLRLATVATRLRKIAAMMAVLGIAALGAVLARHILQDHVHPSAGEIRLIVLPFENLGPPEDDYHADIVTAVTTACLDGIRGMRIVPRRSAMRYRNKDVDLPHVAEELGLDYILEGTIHRERPADPNSQVTITPVLIRASDDTQVWSWSFGHYPNNVLRLQSELAEQVAQALDIALPEPTRHALGSRPTASREAYLYYLGGNDYMYRSPHERNFKAAIQMYRMAVESDPAFTLAYAQLSRVHCKMYWYLYDRSDKRLADAKQALDRATQLDPDLPEVHLARGEYCYHGLRDYEEALEQFAFVRRHQPDNRDLLTLTGAVQRQQERYEDALANMKEAHKLDPLSGTLPTEIATTLVALRDYPEAGRYYDLAISRAPDVHFAYYFKAWLYLYWKGDTEASRTILEQAVEFADGAREPLIVASLINIDLYEEDYTASLRRLSSWGSDCFDTHFYFVPKKLVTAQIHGLMGKRKLELADYESARRILEAEVQKRPGDDRLHGSLGLAHAGLGRTEDAIREGKLGRDKDLAHIYVMVGDFDAAIDQLESLLSAPWGMSIPLLKLDPVWAPLRNHPRFKQLLKAGR